jgi:hypothetical protein
VEATAPKKKAFTTQIDVAPKQTDAHVTVSLANDDQAVAVQTQTTPPPQVTATTAPPAEEPTSNNGSVQRTLGWVGVGVGVAGLAVGGIFGLTAMSKASEASNDGCKGSTCTGAHAGAGVQATKDGLTDATISTVGFVAGGVLAAAGVVLVLTAPSGKAVHAAPAVGSSFVGLSLSTDW